jgi:O-antigen ligase/tetratricopeptide (TPR) repeat protein
MSKSFRESVRRPLESFIFYGILTVTALTAVPFGTVDPFWVAVFEAAVFGFTILWLIDGLHTGSWWNRDHLVLIPLFALVLFALIQSSSYGTSFSLSEIPTNEAISAAPFESRRFSLKLLAISLTFGLLLRYTSNLRRMRVLIFVVIGVAVGSALFGLLKNGLLNTAGVDSIRERLSSTGSYAQFDSRNHFALLMEAAIGLLLALALVEWRHLKRLVIYLLMGCLMWTTLLLTHSRGAIVSLIVVVIVFLLLFISLRITSPRRNTSSKRTIGLRWRTSQVIVGLMIVSLVIGVVGATAAFVGGEETVRRFELTPTEFANDQAGPLKLLRPQIWRATLDVIKDNPVAGAGFSAFSTAIPRYLNASGEWTPEQVHNEYLELLASGGLIGALLGVWFVVMIGKRIRARVKHASDHELIIKSGALAGLCGIAVHSMFDFGLHVTTNGLICIALIVVAVTPFSQLPVPGARTHRILRVSFVVCGVVVCLVAIRGVVPVGYARSLAADANHDFALLDHAVHLSPNDPELYVARARSAVSRGEIERAIADSQTAIALKPGDYKLWLQLGRLLEKGRRDDFALEAYSRAEALAPFYATPHWEKAELFHKRGEDNTAFAEYRKATLSDPRLFNRVIEIAWESYAPDVRKTESLVDPKTDSEKLIFAHFCIQHGRAIESLPVIRSVAHLSPYDRHQLLRSLFAQKEFRVAYELWADAPPKTETHPTPGSIPDGGFESGRISNDAGFTWTDGEAAATRVSTDDSIRWNGNHSLRINWTGGPEPNEDVISLVVLVEPLANYQLKFAARSYEVISGVAPIFTVSDAIQADGATKPSVELPSGTSDWQRLSMPFKTGPSTNVIRISLQKQRCKHAQCPIFGTHWLDDFVLTKAVS